MKNIHLNFLSFVNVGLGFFFIILLGRKLGLGLQTDIYFFSLIIVAYLEQLVGVTWLAVKHYYAELKVNRPEVLNKTYIILLNNIFVSSFLIICTYFFVTRNFNVLNEGVQQFMDVYIYMVMIHSVLTYNKKILNLEHSYASVYLVDIFVYGVNLLAVLFILEGEVLLLAYSTIFSSLLVVIWQQWRIFSLNNFRYHFVFYDEELTREIFKSSLKLNASSILYGFKDIVVALVFTAAGSGIYSLYSYASKFVGAVSSIVCNPIENVYAAQISHIVAKRQFTDAIDSVRKVIVKTSLGIVLSCAFIYFWLPYILKTMITDGISIDQIDTVQYIFVILSAYSLLKAIELPFGKILNLLKLFNFGIFINFIYFVVVILGYYLVELNYVNTIGLLYLVIGGQCIKLFLQINKYRSSFLKLNSNTDKK
jgi:peptidoglycan biosynthesis protein MviN/MurJ (putative lipid II flippase)